MESVDVSMSVFFVKQKTAYEMRISDWSSDVCASDLGSRRAGSPPRAGRRVAVAAWRPPPAPAPGPSGTATSRPARSASGRRWCRATGLGAPCAGGRRGSSCRIRGWRSGSWSLVSSLCVLPVGSRALLCLVLRRVGPVEVAQDLRHARQGGQRALALDLDGGQDLGEIAVAAHLQATPRSEARRVGKACVSPCRSRCSPYHSKKKPKH